ncbi:hypothetical protein [Ramlibacter sp. AN1133]|uniref:hypothetical protein n=1 Tax=Ramlibacter sp. AN1133 TaxID=3133429 RepID=UPI0030C35EED
MIPLNAKACLRTGSLLLAFVLYTLPLSAAPEVASFTREKVRPLNANVAFSVPLDRKFRVGQRLILPLGASAEARALLANGFQLRIFRVAASGVHPKPLDPFFDPCYVFLSTVLPFVGGTGANVVIEFADFSWLSIPESGPVGPGHFLLVVQVGGDADPTFRLEGDLKKYFDSGFYFEVGARDVSPTQIANERTLNAEYFRKVKRRAQLNRPDIKCFRPEARYRSDEEEFLAYLQPPCAPELDLTTLH